MVSTPRALAIGIIILSGVGGYWLVATQQASAITDIKASKAGDRLGAFTVRSVKPINEQMPVSQDNMAVELSGTATVEATVIPPDEYADGYRLTLTGVSASMYPWLRGVYARTPMDALTLAALTEAAASGATIIAEIRNPGWGYMANSGAGGSAADIRIMQ